MGYPTKIATCCHCGSTTTLQVDKGLHALSCASCGAPLRNLKMLPKSKRKSKHAVSHQFPGTYKSVAEHSLEPKRAKPRKRKTRSKWFKSIASDVFDLVEDIFD
ncbi:MAG: hypothetical protein AAF755_12015 [Pseudomonadota bacterium]